MMKMVHRITGYGHHEVSDQVAAGLTARYGDEGTFSVLSLAYGAVRDDDENPFGDDVHNFVISPVTLAYLCATTENILADYSQADRDKFMNTIQQARSSIGTATEQTTTIADEFAVMMRQVDALKEAMPDLGDDLDTLVRAATRIQNALHGGEGGTADDDPADRDTADIQEHEGQFPDAGLFGIDKMDAELMRWSKQEQPECGQVPCEHAPDGGNHPVAGQ